jgi:hypothetical protein
MPAFVIGPAVASLATSIAEIGARMVIPFDSPHSWYTLHKALQWTSVKMANTWGEDVPHTCLGILVNTGSQAVNAEVRGEVVIIERFPEQVDVRLECGDRISKIEELNSPEEDPAAGAVAIVEVHFSLETEVE